MFNLPYVASIYLDYNCLSCQLPVFHKEMEEVCLVTILTLPDVPVDQIPFEVCRIDSSSTLTPRYTAFLPRFHKSRIKKLKKNLRKCLSGSFMKE